MPVSATSFGISVAINWAIACGCLCFFSVLRTHNITRKFYAPKRAAPDVQVKPRRLKPLLWTWPFEMFTFTEQEMVDVSGLDAVVFLRIFSFGIELFSWLSFIGLVVLVPLHYTDTFVKDQIASGKATTGVTTNTTDTSAVSVPADACKSSKSKETPVYSDIDHFYLTNITDGSMRLWCHVVLVYWFTFITIWLLFKYNTQLSKMRVLFVANQPKGGPSHTAMVTDIPGPFIGTMLEALSRLISHGFLRFAPRSLKRKVNDIIEHTFGAAVDALNNKGMTTMMGDVLGTMQRFGSGRRSQDTELGEIPPPQTAKVEPEPPVYKKRKNARRTEEEIGSLDMWPTAIRQLKNGVTMKEMVDSEFKRVYGDDEVLSVNPVYEQAPLEPLLAAYNKTKTELEDILDQYISLMKRRKHIKKRFEVSMGCFPTSKGKWAVDLYGSKKFTKVDAIEFYTNQLRELKGEIRRVQEECLRDITPSAFVTFGSRETQVVAATSLHCHDETVWRTQDAPGVLEVVWENLQMRAWERSFRNMVIWGCFVALLITYIPIVAVIQAPLNMKQLDKTPVIKDLVGISFVRGIIEGILPSLVLKIFLAILPMLLAFMNRKAGMISISQIDFGVVQKLFIFQIVAVFFVQAGLGTLLSNFKKLRQTLSCADYSTLFGILGSGVPQQATFFMSFILLNGLSANPIGFLRIPGLVIFWIMSKLAATERARMRLWAEQTLMFGTEVTGHMMTIFLGLVFSVLAPLILPVALLYFVVGSAIYRYQMLYVFTTVYQTGGKMWMVVFHQVMTSLYFFQLVTILVLALKKFPFVFLIIPVIPLTLVCHIAIVTIFARPWRVTSLQAAARLDVLDREVNNGVPLTEAEIAHLKDDYLSPCFKVSEKQYEELLAEADRVSTKLVTYLDHHERGQEYRVTEEHTLDGHDDARSEGTEVMGHPAPPHLPPPPQPPPDRRATQERPLLGTVQSQEIAASPSRRQ